MTTSDTLDKKLAAFQEHQEAPWSKLRCNFTVANLNAMQKPNSEEKSGQASQTRSPLMIHFRALPMIVILTITTLLLNACGTSTSVPGPIFEGRLLFQVITHSNENVRPGLYELTRNPVSGEVAVNMLVPDLPDLRADGHRLWDLVIWDNKAFLLYTTKEDIRWRDLQTGEESSVFSQATDCVSAAPDGKMLSFTIGDKLYIYNVVTKIAESIFQSPAASYGGGTSVAGFSCGIWIGPDRLVFQRRVGDLPSSVDLYKGIPSDTITLALINEEVTFVDKPAEFMPNIEVSPDGKYVLMTCKEDGFFGPCFFQTQTLSNLETPGKLMSCYTEDRCYRIGFTPDSQEFVIERNPPDGPFLPYFQLIFVDPDTLDERPGPKIPLDWNNWVWSPDSQNYVAFEEARESPETNFHSVKIGDLNTGGETTLWEPGKDVFLYILAWLPE